MEASASARVQPASNFLAIHRASPARCGPSTSDPATAPSKSTIRARAVAFGPSPRRRRPLEETLREPRSLTANNGARRVRRIGELAHRMLQRAAAEVLRRRPLHHQVKKLERAFLTTAYSARCLDVRAGVHGSALEKGRHELVLAAEVQVERGLRRVGFRQQAVDTHGPHALPVEQAVGGVKEAVTDAGFGGFRPFPRLSAARLDSTDRSVYCQTPVNRQNCLFTASRMWLRVQAAVPS